MLAVDSTKHTLSDAGNIVLEQYTPAYDIDDIRTLAINDQELERTLSINENTYEDNKIHKHHL